MERNQAIEILETINELYPKFELTERKIRVLLPQLEKMDYDRVVKKLNDYIVSSPFPPTLADIAAYAPPKNETLEKIKQWEKEAAEVSEETKQKFKQKLEELEQKIKEKSE